jgi:hypothetical protein
MTTANVRAVLRIFAVLTMFAAAIFVSVTILGNWSMNRFMQAQMPRMNVDVSVTNMSEFAVTNMSGYTMLVGLVVSLWGLILYVLSPAIARHITSDPDLVVTPDAEASSHGEVAHG